MRPIVMCGIPRSGTTLVWQILQEVFSDHVIYKTHPGAWEPDDSAVVGTIRSPYDVAASLYRVRLSRGGQDAGNEDDLNTILNRVGMYFNCMEDIRDGHCVIRKYEDFYENNEPIYDAILKMFGIWVAAPERARINDKFSLSANKERASKLANFNEVGDYGIHGDHIGGVVPKSWYRILPDWALVKTAEVCYPIAKRWGYE